MSAPDSPTRRRPVPPPKTESQARLREDLTSPVRAQRDASQQYAEGRDVIQGKGLDTEAQKREALKHLTLPPGWDLRNSVDVTYHTHIAKPVVHETVLHENTELIEPKITREYHLYHQYDYVQPLEVEVPENSYATNADGEVIHAPGGLATRAGPSSYWEQDRQDRGYSLSDSLERQQGREKTEMEAERDKIAGPFPLQAEGGGERVLHGIRDGVIAKRFGGALTSPERTTSHSDQQGTRDALPIRPRGGGFDNTSPYQQSHPNYAPQTPPGSRDGIQQRHEKSSTPDRNTGLLEQDFNRLSLQQQHGQSDAKALPPIPDTSPRSPHGGSSVRRMSGEKKLRERYSSDLNRRSLEGQNPMIDDEVVPERNSSARKTRLN